MNFDRLLAKTFIIFISTTLTIVLIEIGFRTFVQFTPPNPYLINETSHVPRPYVMAVAEPKLDAINSLGYKGALPVMPKPKGEKRVFILGGSVVYGIDPLFGDLEQNNEAIKTALPGLIETRLQKRFGTNVKLYNFGITSTVATQELVRLVIDVINFEPDLIISYSGGNDLLQPSHAGYPHRFIFYEVNPLWITNIQDYPLFHLIAFGSQAARNLFGSYFENYFLSQSRQKPFGNHEVPFFYDDIANYSSSIIKMSKISKAFGAEFVGVLHPIKDMVLDGKKIKENYRKWAKDVQSKLHKESDDKKLAFWNLIESLNDQPSSIWEDVIHLNLPGNERMADILSEKIAESFSDTLSAESH